MSDQFQNTLVDHLGKYRLKHDIELQFQDDLYAEYQIHENLSGFSLTFTHIQNLALELAQQEKYQEKFKNYKFAEDWVRKFRKRYKIPYISTRSQNKAIA